MICFGNCFKKAICKFKLYTTSFYFSAIWNKSVEQEEEEQKQCDKGYAKTHPSDVFLRQILTNKGSKNLQLTEYRNS